MPPAVGIAAGHNYRVPLRASQHAGWQKGSMFEEVYFIPGKEAAAK
jgi:hypothetical protein